jgi:hypothetical protein
MSDDSQNALNTLLATLTPGMVVFVPDEVLSHWFPPGLGSGSLSQSQMCEAARIASAASCVFEYVAERSAGSFKKLARC